MILVLLGTQNNSFHRLLEEVQKNIDNGNIKEEVVAQKGYTKFESKDMTLYNKIPTDEVKKLIDTAYKSAQQILLQNMDLLHAIAAELIAKEKINEEEFNKFFM